MALHPIVQSVTDRIIARSRPSRSAYLAHLDAARVQGVQRSALACTNLAHGFAAFPENDKLKLKEYKKPSIAIVSAYNDMLSAHQPFARFPEIIKDAVREVDAVAQFAGGTPAMCDGVTQGQPGMELSLFSRDTIAMSTAVALSHNMFDAALYLGVCDKIVPGLLIGALHFGHLPAVFVPAGPMTSGMSNKDKAAIRQRYAKGLATREELLEGESASYHSAGTCTFYGTANSNQVLMEFMGLHLPGSSFITPNTPLRDALTRAAAQRAVAITQQGGNYTPVGHVVDEKSIVNAIIGLLATGGSTNHTLHLVAIAKAAGIVIDWDDFNELSSVIPLLTRIYPNGEADVNHFNAAGGPGFIIRELLDAGLLHDDVATILGRGLRNHCTEPFLEGDKAVWRAAAAVLSGDDAVLRPASAPFSQRRRPDSRQRQSGPRRHEGVGREGSAPRGGSARADLQFAGRLHARLPGRPARSRFRRRAALPGPARQRHAGTARAHARAVEPAGRRPPRGAGDGRAHVGRFGQGAGGDPRLA